MRAQSSSSIAAPPANSSGSAAGPNPKTSVTAEVTGKTSEKMDVTPSTTQMTGPSSSVSVPMTGKRLNDSGEPAFR